MTGEAGDGSSTPDGGQRQGPEDRVKSLIEHLAESVDKAKAARRRYEKGCRCPDPERAVRPDCPLHGIEATLAEARRNDPIGSMLGLYEPPPPAASRPASLSSPEATEEEETSHG